ncbi:MAG: PEP-utilizing enzyme, partial [Candidatus Komeilibacteria bacterium]|nr:PEP-utilizing enzyme [Candidatus Komeilibacteria bacterium]
ILNRKWEYFISRNLTVWHDELSLIGGVKHYPIYRLPKFYQLRIHHHNYSDFYQLKGGEGSHLYFQESLRRNFKKPGYIKFLEVLYKKQSRELLRLAKKLPGKPDLLKNFFDSYSKATCLLHISTVASKFLTDDILRSLKALSEQERHEVISYYSRPKQLASLQQLDREVAKLFKAKKLNISKAAEQLAQKYNWIPVNFVGEPWGLDYFIDRLKSYQPSRHQIYLKPKIKISQKTLINLKLLGKISYLNEYRKAVFSQTNLIIRSFWDKLAKNHKLSDWRDINFLLTTEIFDLIGNKADYQKKLIKQRQDFFALYNAFSGGVGLLDKKETFKFINKFTIKAAEFQKVSGTTANRGKIKGAVKIVNSSKDFNKFNQGDILVAKMTSVDFIPIMKKAGAFVTDEGGLACHAAIIAREYNKPCIIGTKIATQVLKNGDLVEVDANKGIVKKLT